MRHQLPELACAECPGPQGASRKPKTDPPAASQLERAAGPQGTPDAALKRSPPLVPLLVALALSIGDGPRAVAAQQSPSAAPQPPGAEDLLSLRDIGDIQVSPSGGTTVFTVSAADLSSNRVRTTVMTLATDGGQPVELAAMPAGASNLRWSPDGRRLAFFAARDGKSALWTLEVATGALTRICDYERGNAFLAHVGEWLAWAPDGQYLAFVGSDQAGGPLPDPVVVTRLQYKSRTSFADNRRVHVFVAPAGGGPARQITSGAFDEHSIAWTADGREIVFASNREPDPDVRHNYDLYAVEVATGTIRQITKTPGVEMAPNVSPDGRWIAYTATTRPVTSIDSVAEDAHLWIVPVGGGQPREVNGALDRRTSAVQWTADGSALVFSASDQGRTLVYRVARDGGPSVPLLDRPAQMGPYSLARDGSIVFGMTTPTRPREVFRLAVGAREPQPLTSFNSNLVATWRLSEPETIRYRSFDGVDVQGWLYPPAGRSARVPMLLNIHGGPHGMFGYGFDPLAQLYAARGYAVLMINPRGSSGYGQRFSDGCVGDWGGADYEDLMAGVDHALKTHAEIDPERLGVTGRSYGGYMNNWVITQTSRFKASVSWASVSNLISFYATSIYQDLVHAEFNGFPWDRDNFTLLWQRSPLAHVAKVVTPTLFLHGEQDNDVHITEAEHMYTALRRRGIEAALARYPREGHAFREPRHRLDSMTRAVAWMDRYLMKQGSAPPSPSR